LFCPFPSELLDRLPFCLCNPLPPSGKCVVRKFMTFSEFSTFCRTQILGMADLPFLSMSEPFLTSLISRGLPPQSERSDFFPHSAADALSAFLSASYCPFSTVYTPAVHPWSSRRRPFIPFLTFLLTGNPLMGRAPSCLLSEIFQLFQALPHKNLFLPPPGGRVCGVGELAPFLEG